MRTSSSTTCAPRDRCPAGPRWRAPHRLTSDQLLSAIERRDVIGQAKGILVERVQLDADGAFDVLRGISNRTNTKLVDVARDIVLGRTTTTGQAASSSQRTARSAKRTDHDLVEDH